MAAANRGTRDSLIEALESKAWSFEFHQAVRLLEAALEGDPVGRTSNPSREGVRFRSQVSLAFPASELTSVRLSPKGTAPKRAEVEVAFLGLANASGPLPRPFTEWILDRLARKDTAFRDFLDIFNHRLVSYHYRSREKHRPGLRLISPEKSTLGEPLFALAGLAEATLRNRSQIPDRALIPYATAVGRTRPVAQLLAGTLTHHFGVPFKPVPFRGRWCSLEPDQWTRLGSPPPSGGGPPPPTGATQGLGVDTVLGTRIWDQSAVFELEAGPLDQAAFLSFLPSAGCGRVPAGPWLSPLSDLVQMQTTPGTRVEVRLSVAPGALPPARLTNSDTAPRLGYTSWLGRQGNLGELSRDVVISLGKPAPKL